MTGVPIYATNRKRGRSIKVIKSRNHVSLARKSGLLIQALTFFAGFFLVLGVHSIIHRKSGNPIPEVDSKDSSNFALKTNFERNVTAATSIPSETLNSEVQVGIERDVNVTLVLSIQKTGTTALEWIAQALFKHLAQEIKFQNMDSADFPVVINEEKHHEILWRGKRVVFEFMRKHTSDKIDPALPINFTVGAASECVREGVPAFSEQCHHLHEQLENMQVDISFGQKENQLYFTTFRNPISTIVSWIYYKHPNSNKESVSSLILRTKKCAKEAADMSFRYAVVTELMPALGYEIMPLYYNNMREHPVVFIEELANKLGLIVNEKIVRAVVRETSPEYMRGIQKDLANAKERYGGIAAKGKNSRKIRNAEVNGFDKDLSSKALKKCMNEARFHLSPALIQQFQDTFG